MNKIYRKDLGNMQTSFLLKIKQTLLRRMELKDYMTKQYNNMLIDVLGELDFRQIPQKAD